MKVELGGNQYDVEFNGDIASFSVKFSDGKLVEDANVLTALYHGQIVADFAIRLFKGQDNGLLGSVAYAEEARDAFLDVEWWKNLYDGIIFGGELILSPNKIKSIAQTAVLKAEDWAKSYVYFNSLNSAIEAFEGFTHEAFLVVEDLREANAGNGSVYLSNDRLISLERVLMDAVGHSELTNQLISNYDGLKPEPWWQPIYDLGKVFIDFAAGNSVNSIFTPKSVDAFRLSKFEQGMIDILLDIDWATSAAEKTIALEKVISGWFDEARSSELGSVTASKIEDYRTFFQAKFQEEDNSPKSSNFSIYPQDPFVDEGDSGNKELGVVVSRDNDDFEETVYVATLPGTASAAGKDYQGLAYQKLVFGVGEANASTATPILIMGDVFKEGTESFQVVVSSAPNLPIGQALATSTVTILEEASDGAVSDGLPQGNVNGLLRFEYSDQAVTSGSVTSLDSLFTNIEDLDQLSDISWFHVSDRTDGGGYLTKNGVKQTMPEIGFLTDEIENLSQWSFVAGTAGAIDELGFTIVQTDGDFSPQIKPGLKVTSKAETGSGNQGELGGSTITNPTENTGENGYDFISKITELEASNYYPGGLARLRFEVANIGDKNSASMKYGVFLSADSNVTRSDKRLLSEGSGFLDPEEVVKDSVRFEIPDDFGTEFYIGVISDYENKRTELDETNNTAFVKVDVSELPSSLADIEIEYVSDFEKPNLIFGEKFEALVRVKNSGTGYAERSDVSFYLSADGNFDEDEDLLLGNDFYGSNRNGVQKGLEPGEGDYVRAEFTITESMFKSVSGSSDPANLYIVMELDEDRRVVEDRRGNNDHAIRLNFAKDSENWTEFVDHIVSAFTIESERSGLDEKLEFGVEFKNLGNVEPVSTYKFVDLFATSVKTGENWLVSSAYTEDYRRGVTAYGANSFQPSTRGITEPGYYELQAVIRTDSAELDERKDNNESLSKRVFFGSELEKALADKSDVSPVSIDVDLSADGVLNIVTSIENFGEQISDSGSSASIFLVDPNQTSSKSILTTQTIGAISGAEDLLGPIEVLFDPISLPEDLSGSYSFGVELDVFGELDDARSSNNELISSQKFRVRDGAPVPLVEKTITIQPGPEEGQDVSITSVFWADTNHGRDQEILRTGGWGDWYYSLLKFDVTQLPENVTGAEIYLYSPKIEDNRFSHDAVELYRVLGDWDEMLGWKDEDRPSTEFLRTLSTPTEEPHWFKFDVLDLVNEWQSGLEENHGIQLQTTGNSAKLNDFYSSDWFEAALRPKLVVTWLDEVIEKNGAIGPDFDGNGTDDILFFNESTRTVGQFRMPEATWGGIGAAGSNWEARGVGLFDGDDTSADILWFNTSTRAVGRFDMVNGSRDSWQGIGKAGVGWEVKGAGDFDNDGIDDILWFNDSLRTTGQFRVDSSGNASWVGIGSTGFGWEITGIGDFNGDNFADILWFNDNTNTLGQFRMAETGRTWVGLTSFGNGFKVAGTGDFNGDGVDDILVFNASTRALGQFDMNEGMADWISLGSAGIGWNIEGTGDFNGDGKDDILWRHSDGRLGQYQMDGENYSWDSIGLAGSAWDVVL